MKTVRILGRTIPVAIVTFLLLAGAGLALLTVYITVTGSATVRQSVTLNAIESTYKYPLVPFTEFAYPGVTSYAIGSFDAVGGDEQDVWLKLSNYAEILAPIELEKIVTGPDSQPCLADKVTFYKPDVAEVPLCTKDTTSWECIEGPKGTVKYAVYGPVLKIEVFLYGLDPNAYYQIALNGREGVDGNEVIAKNCPKPNQAADEFTKAWECGMWGTEGFWNFEMVAKPDASGFFYKEYQLPLGDIVFDDILHFGPGIGIIVKYAGEDPHTYEGPWTPAMMENAIVEFWVTQVCHGVVLDSQCSEGVSGTVTELPARPFKQNPLIPSETWYCVRNEFHLAATPGSYDFAINVNPV